MYKFPNAHNTRKVQLCSRYELRHVIPVLWLNFLRMLFFLIFKFELTLIVTDCHRLAQISTTATDWQKLSVSLLQTATDYHRPKINKSCNKFKVSIQMNYCLKFPKIYIGYHKLPKGAKSYQKFCAPGCH